MEIEQPSRENLLKEAAQSIFTSAKLDSTGQLAYNNLLHGIARIAFAARQIERSAVVRFFASADFTVTRSGHRWGSGFSYGGLLEVISPTPIVMPEVRPNTCGCLVGVLPCDLPLTEIVDKIASLAAEYPPGSWDYSRRNHFVNIYRSSSLGKKIIIIHGCPESLRSDTEERPGLYLENSPYWSKRITVIDTPIGPTRMLVGSEAVDYWHTYEGAEDISMQQRREVALSICADTEIVANETHEGMLGLGQYALGCHAAKRLGAQFPVLTSIGSPAYLVTAPPGRRPQQLTPAGILAVLPHGTGYKIPMAKDLARVSCAKSGRLMYYFRSGGSSPVAIMGEFGNVPFQYRSPNIIQEWAEQNVFRIVDRLEPEVFTKL